ncbi:HAD family hydrolase [Haliovirga abyssi]|uniref:2-haloalkanoic acid dehalogenase n=1 Tax=Haliovirga abyssi TaxID=2996794 RepID=A0AAU9D366_9FUSO|nr:HAD family hydrolase [Haliovirga abyssi]BDU50411.1 2-haloalkanoic acid dehalogenase [Haliovirga abyssi]
MKLKALFLDFYGTLVHEDDEIIPVICKRIEKSTDLNVSIEEIGRFWWQEFHELFMNSYGDNFKTQRIIEKISLDRTLEYFSSSEDSDDLCQLLFNHWQRPKIFEDTKKFIESVNVPICVVSNIDRVDINNAIKFHNLKFDCVLTSEDAKSYKPRKELFELALNEMKLSNNEVIHIGDSIRSDILGAKKCGIKSIWLKRNKMNKTNEVIENICIDLNEVKSLMEKII